MVSLASLPEATAFAAVLVAWHGVRPAARQSAVATSLRNVYVVIAGVMGFRLLDQSVHLALVSAAVMILAAWLPLAALLLVEQICRRHAPWLLKIGALGGAIFFTVIALSAGLYWDRAALIALALFQAVAAVAMAGLLIGSRRDMTYAEKQVADTFLLTILLTIPLALTDFDVILPDAPVRGGGFAAIVLILATSRLARGEGSPLSLLGDIFVGIVGAVIAAAATYLIAAGEPARDALVAAASVGFLVAALALLVERFANIRSDSRRLVSALANMPDDPSLSDVVHSHPLLVSARLVDANMLGDYPTAAVQALVRHRLIDRDIPDDKARDPARDILEATAGTHLLRLSIDPPRFLAVSGGELTGAGLRDELLVAAMLIERRV